MFGPIIPGLAEGVGTGATAGATAAGSAAGFPWAIALPIVWNLVSGLFGDGEDDIEEQMLRAQQLQRRFGGYQPSKARMSALDSTIAQALLSQMGRTFNWGWPAEMGIDTSFIERALQLPGVGGSTIRRA